jgi:hypothetical protein
MVGPPPVFLDLAGKPGGVKRPTITSTRHGATKIILERAPDPPQTVVATTEGQKIRQRHPRQSRTAQGLKETSP